MTDTPDRPDRRPKFLRSFSSWALPRSVALLRISAISREEFVQQRKWLDERAYADLVALCQFLPGPASSQVGMAIGLSRLGISGLWPPGRRSRCLRRIALVLFRDRHLIYRQLGGGGMAARPEGGGRRGRGPRGAGHGPDAHTGPPPGVARRRSGRNRDHGPDCVGTGGCHSPGRVRWPDPANDGAPSDHVSLPLAIPRSHAVVRSFLFCAAADRLAAPRGLLRQPGSPRDRRLYRLALLVFGGGHVVLPLLQPNWFQTVGSIASLPRWLWCGTGRTGALVYVRRPISARS